MGWIFSGMNRMPWNLKKFCIVNSFGAHSISLSGNIIFKINYLYIVIQEIAIGIIFLTALAYVGRLMYKSFQAKHACTTGCGKCGAEDLSKMEEQISKSSFVEILKRKS